MPLKVKPVPPEYCVFVSVEDIVPLPAIAMLFPAVRAATTLAVSVTSADDSIASSFVPSVAISRPSTVPLTFIAPVTSKLPPTETPEVVVKPVVLFKWH